MGRLSGVSVIVLAGCAGLSHAPAPAKGAEPAAVELVRPFALPGETMELSATLRGLPVGRLVSASGKAGIVDGRRALIVKSRGQSTGMIALLAELTWEQTSTIDLDHGYVIDAKEETWSVVAGGDKEHDERSIGDESAHDVHSAIAAVRAWRSVPGQRGKLAVRFGSASIDVTLIDAGHAYLASAGEPAVRYDGVFEDETKFSAWVSDDIARVPLRFECDLDPFGMIVVELAHYAPPRDDE